MDSSNAKFVEYLLRKEYRRARSSAISALHADRLNTQAWISLGESCVHLNQGEMARFCFERASILDPLGKWFTHLVEHTRLVERGVVDKGILRLLRHPAVKVSAVILTKNNEETISDCIHALLSAVDEIVVVDTGSTDSTVELVERVGLNVHHFAWGDNFAEARNYAMSLVSTDWVISVDSDEMLYADDANCIRTVAGIYDHLEEPFAVRILQMNSVGTVLEPTSVVRMFKKSCGIHWIGQIHEEVMTEGVAKYLNIVSGRIRLLHRGYDPHIVDVKQKYERNIRLLLSAIANEPNEVRHQLFMGRELRSLGRNEEALKYLRAGEELATWQGHSQLPEILKYQIEIEYMLGNYLEAAQISDRLIQADAAYPEGWFWLAACLVREEKIDVERIQGLISRARETASQYRGLIYSDSMIETVKSDLVLNELKDRMAASLKDN
ncbi:glycosyltransferase [Alicyclobacillus dauci]|uniref:Glycosyltransferase n=1 Tax=Alicyclobacillus dauci TaxID=1475485 RepID=A0ABY6Z2K4_9BACL|nr:glycosyltransferase [Alicyclobacillus dauci]WAH36838.1 glycosyltransferase [Alicyclobacillus dauci]